jgi:hypothetical protein
MRKGGCHAFATVAGRRCRCSQADRGVATTCARLAAGSSTWYVESTGWFTFSQGGQSRTATVPLPRGQVGWYDMYGYGQIQEPVGTYGPTIEVYAPY